MLQIQNENVQEILHRGLRNRKGPIYYALKFFWFVWKWVVPQKLVSRIFGKFLEISFSRFLVRPACLILGGVKLQNFKPASGEFRYKSFQDFYIRKRVDELPTGRSGIRWPCDGLLAAVIETKGYSSPPILVKGHYLGASAIFGAEIDVSTPWIANVYLGVMDYHRFHCPVNGTVIKVQRFHGRLETVNPIFYRQPFQPSFLNERVVLTLSNENGCIIRMAIVGAAFAGSIVLHKHVVPGTQVISNEEIGFFRLGSQICMTTPIAPNGSVGENVTAGSALDGPY